MAVHSVLFTYEGLDFACLLLITDLCFNVMLWKTDVVLLKGKPAEKLLTDKDGDRWGKTKEDEWRQ